MPTVETASLYKILLVGNYESGSLGSMHAYLRMLRDQLHECGHVTEAIYPARIAGPSDDRTTGLGKWLAYLDRFVIFGPRLWWRSRKFDIVHIVDHANAMNGMVVPRRKLVITCHDVIAIQAARGLIPGWTVGITGRIFQWLILTNLKRASRVICVSDLTRRDFVGLTEPRCKNVVTINNGLNNSFYPLDEQQIVTVKRHLGLDPALKYYLHVGTDLPRKNRGYVGRMFAGAMTALGDTLTALVLVGPPPTGELQAFIEAAGVAKRVHVFDAGVSHEQLVALYSGATGLLFPSLNEGFGWPIIEAQACGCPVFTANRAPMSEIGGSAAAYFDPLDVEDGIRSLLTGRADAARMRREGLDNAARFSPQSMIVGYVDVYGRVIDESR